MNKEFLKKDQLQLINGGYLSNRNEEPVINEEFVKAQKHAEYIITYAELAKTKDFTGRVPDSLESLKLETLSKLQERDTKYVKDPEMKKRPLNTQLAEEAMSFVSHQKIVDENKKINTFLQQFNVINEFEEFGLFFDQGIVKLNKIYTIKEVTKAVKSIVSILD